MKRRRKKQLYNKYLSELIFDVSRDPVWRARLFSALAWETIPSSAEDLRRRSPGLQRIIRRYNLKFTVFNDGWTNEGFVVFGFSCVEFPYIDAYSTNNPNVI